MALPLLERSDLHSCSLSVHTIFLFYQDFVLSVYIIIVSIDVMEPLQIGMVALIMSRTSPASTHDKQHRVLIENML